MEDKLQAFMNAIDEIHIKELSDSQLKDYYATCYNEYLDVLREMHKRGINP